MYLPPLPICTVPVFDKNLGYVSIILLSIIIINIYNLKHNFVMVGFNCSRDLQHSLKSGYI